MKTYTYRMKDDVAKELEYLSQIYDTSKTAVLDALIRADYNRYEEDPEMKKALDALNEMKRLAESLKA